MKWVGCLAVVALLVASPSLASSEGPAPSKRSCSTINLGGPRVFTKHNMRCAKGETEGTTRLRVEREPPTSQLLL